MTQEISQYLESIRTNARLDRSDEPAVMSELEAHIEDKINELTESGLSHEEAVKTCIRNGSPGGGHIISTSNSLHGGIRPELYRVMLEAARKYGEYPIRV